MTAPAAAPAPAVRASRARSKPHILRLPGWHDAYGLQTFPSAWFVRVWRPLPAGAGYFDLLGPYRHWRDAAPRAAARHGSAGR
jgi:hypothetical protein